MDWAIASIQEDEIRREFDDHMETDEARASGLPSTLDVPGRPGGEASGHEKRKRTKADVAVLR